MLGGLESTGWNQSGTGPKPISYRDLNRDPNTIFNRSKLSGNLRIGDPFTSMEEASHPPIATQD